MIPPRAEPRDAQPSVSLRYSDPAGPDAAGESPGVPAETGPSVVVKPAGAEPATVAAGPSVQFPPMEVDRGPADRRQVALTFDAGADYRPVRQVLEALAAEGVKCTFFLTGEWVKANPKTTRRIVAEGHEIANHSWDHADFTRLSDDAIRDQLRRTEAAIQDTVGKTSRPYFRPPLGARDRRVRTIVGEEGYMTVYWSLDSRDSVQPGITAEEIRRRVTAEIEPGAIVLLHCGSQATADALPDLLRELRARQFRPVTVSALLARQ